MASSLHQSAFLEGFACLGDACEDTCCKGWGMQLDPVTKAKYEKQAPELLDAVTTGEAELIMKRDPQTDYCVKFAGGLCGIHQSYGTDFLGDACHFFPRSTRSLGDRTVMTAALSCPEVTRLALFGESGLTHREAAYDRLPWSLKNYLPEALDSEGALTVHRAFLEAAGAEDAPPERVMARLHAVATSLEMLDQASWPQAAGFYLKNADMRLAPPEPNPNDPFNLLHALAGLLSAAKPSPRPRLEQTIADMERALCVTLDPHTRAIITTPESFPAWQRLYGRWEREWATALRPVLARWLQAQLAIALYPFGGFGESPAERMAIIGVRFATVRLALTACCAAHDGIPPEQELIRVIQSLSRFLDHLADPTLSLSIYEETGWLRPARLRALVGDNSLQSQAQTASYGKTIAAHQL